MIRNVYSVVILCCILYTIEWIKNIDWIWATSLTDWILTRKFIESRTEYANSESVQRSYEHLSSLVFGLFLVLRHSHTQTHAQTEHAIYEKNHSFHLFAVFIVAKCIDIANRVHWACVNIVSPLSVWGKYPVFRSIMFDSL